MALVKAFTVAISDFKAKRPKKAAAHAFLEAGKVNLAAGVKLG